MTALFIFGTLLDDDLRATVMGQAVAGQPAQLTDFVVERADGGDWPILVARPGGVADGLLLNLNDNALERAAFYEAAFGYVAEVMQIERQGQTTNAQVYRAPGGAGSGQAWSLVKWQTTHAPFTRRAAGEAMALFGTVSIENLQFRMPQIRIRAHSAERAAQSPAPTTLRHDSAAADVVIQKHTVPYQHFFEVGETTLTHALFNGGISAPMTRAGFRTGDAVTVLPYDPARDRVLLVEQFRYGPWLRGDPHPWHLEPIAGRIDPGEDAETSARREAQEEARITIGALHRIGAYYPSPGVLSEHLVSYVGVADLPDEATGVAGLDTEQEDIRSHILSFDAAMALIDTGEAATGPLLLSLLWLDRARERGVFA
ncbi:ADP-ribose pyrophosphatase [Rhodobacteraceae bacterium THAF1]|uniref:NUDIX domain-containing protein n=1 Tax=Palleronia sp. THAF1 TaxID=2587842 RepID=UPI000F3FCC1B|nr:NUDIX domain-containing protein [Palleronia sp. THAF1]QFU09169.1 ADP-ribose pyrophosphatase [Palleronia sp. THAF1]VDC27246.1 ADP-ribose pyrophosphatase [Rhodobacteraceae bacterium THAF1]